MPTLVVPCFNEAKRWDHTYWLQMGALPDFNFIFVDDGSSDDTAYLLTATAKEIGAEVLRLPSNCGKSEAVRVGMNYGLSSMSGGLVGFIDADGGFVPDDVRRLGETSLEKGSKAERSDGIWASRVKLAGRDISRNPLRHYSGRVIGTILSWGADGLPYDTQAGLKFFRNTPELRLCLESPFATRWLFEIEILIRWKETSGSAMKIWEEPVSTWIEIPGSKIVPTEIPRIIRELLLVKRLQIADEHERRITGRTQRVDD